MSKSIFDVVGQAPDDPILGLNEAFKSDQLLVEIYGDIEW